MKRQSENNDLSKKFENYTYPVGDANWDIISARIPSGNSFGFLGDKFANHTVLPSKHVWRGIEANIRSTSRSRFAGFWWYGAAAAIFLLGYFAFQPNNASFNQEGFANKNVVVPTDSTVNSETTQPSQPLAESEKSNSQSNFPDHNGNLVAETTDNESTIEVKADSKIENIQLESAIASSQNASTNYLGESKSTFQETVKDDRFAEANKEQNLNPIKIAGIKPEIDIPLLIATLADDIIRTDLEASDQEKNSKSTPFYDGTEELSQNRFSLLAGSQLAISGIGNYDDSEQDISFNLGAVSGFSPDHEFAFSNPSLPVSQTFSQPIYYGVNGEIKFWNRFSAGIGLGYLRMKSRSSIHYLSESKVKDHEAKYVSVPVFLKYNFVDKSKFTAYTTIGNALDILVWQETVETYKNGINAETNSVSPDAKGNQANLYAGLGMSFKFTNHLGVFAEGSVMRYYSITGNNFYSQQNLWPGFRFGALVSF